MDKQEAYKLLIIRAMAENHTNSSHSISIQSGRLSLDKFPLALARDSAKAFPDGAKGRKFAIITLLALSLDPEMPEDVKRFLTKWGYDAENYPTEIDPRGLYQKFLEAMEEAKQK